MEHHGAVDAWLNGGGAELVHCVLYLHHSSEFHKELGFFFPFPLLPPPNCYNWYSVSKML